VVRTNDNKCALVGSVVSSLHRIKDASNHGTFVLNRRAKLTVTDGGFFVWGDISCRVLGKYRLKFSLFDFRVRGENRSAVYLQSICSEPFEGKKICVRGTLATDDTQLSRQRTSVA
jgi:Velvet factor